MMRVVLTTALALVAWSFACAPASQAKKPTPPAGPDGPRGGGPPSHPLMGALDADNDGVISAAEIQAASAALRKLDRDGDGAVTRHEMRPRRRPRPKPVEGQGPPVARDEREKKILAVLDDLDRNQRRGMMNVPVEDGRLLRMLAESIGAKHVVEVGTSNGYSGIWLCLALGKTGGKLTTFELDAKRASLARKNFELAGVASLVTLVEGDAHKEVVKVEGPVDLVFLDADKQGYVDYLNKLLPKIRPGGLIVAHNMRHQRPGIAEYLEAVGDNKDLETLLLHMQGAGVGVTLKKR